MGITFKLNKKKIKYSDKPMTRLIDFIREKAEITSCKDGCGEGECGAYTVIIDGKLSMAGITPMGSMEGKTVVTVDGINQTEEYFLLERSFKKYGAVQCGFCTPGMVLAGYALLTSNMNPSDEEIREGISGNLCRCTGYLAIIEAIKSASLEGEELWKKHIIPNK